MARRKQLPPDNLPVVSTAGGEQAHHVPVKVRRLSGGRRPQRFGSSWWPAVYCGLLSVVVLGPLLVPSGYVLALDTVWGPHLSLEPGSDVYPRAALPLRLVSWLLRAVLGTELALSVLLFAIFWMAGWSMFRVISTNRSLWRYFATTLYVLNPFVYDRFIAGHWDFLLAYALLPLALQAAYRFLKKPGGLAALKLAAWWTGLTIASFHFLFIFGLVFLVVLALGLLTYRPRKQLLWYWLMTTVVYLVFNLYWVIPAWWQSSGFNYVDATHPGVFATQAEVGQSAWLSVLLLQGFYRQVNVGATTLGTTVPWLFLFVVAIAVYGAVRAIKHPRLRDSALLLSLSAYLAILLAVGVSAFGARELYLFLFTHLPGFTAMREPQKFAVLLVPVYAILGGYGLTILYDRLHKHWQRWLLGLSAFAVVISLAVPLLWGAGGYLARTDYPAGWYIVRQITNQTADGTILVLPWRQYVYLSFVPHGVVLADPAPAVFDLPTLVSRRTDVPGLTNPSDRPLDTVADRLDRGQTLSPEDRAILAQHNVRWIVVLQVPYRGDTQQLQQSSPVDLRYADDDITLFELKPT